MSEQGTNEWYDNWLSHHFYTRVPNLLMRRAATMGLRVNDLAVLLYLMSWMTISDPERELRRDGDLRTRNIEQALGISRYAVMRSVTRLEGYGYVIVKRAVPHPNRYWIDIRKLFDDIEAYSND